MKKLSERIKSLRMPGETQSAFAQRLGTTQASISRYLNGRQPDRETLIKIARRTGVNLDWLLTGNQPGPQEAPPKGKSDATLVQAALAYLSDLSDMSAREKNRMNEMIRDIIQSKQTRKELISAWEGKFRKRRK